MAFQRIVKILLVLLAVLAVSINAQLNHIADVNSGNLKVSQHQLDQNPIELVQHVLNRIGPQGYSPTQLTRNQLGQGPFNRLPLDQRKKIVIKNNPGHDSLGFENLASGGIELRKNKYGDQNKLIQDVLGAIQIDQHKRFVQQPDLKKAVQQQPAKPQLGQQQLSQQGYSPTQLTRNQLGQGPFNRLPLDQRKKIVIKNNPGHDSLGFENLASGGIELRKNKYGDQNKLIQDVLGAIQTDQHKRFVQQPDLKKVVQQQPAKPQLGQQQLSQQQLGHQKLGQLGPLVQEEEPTVKPNDGQQQQKLTGQQAGNNKRPQNNKIRPQFNQNPANNGQQKLFISSIPELGRVRGRLGVSQWTGKRIIQFFDIPYAQAPVGELRFKPSLPVKPWTGVMKANKPHPGCPSLQNFKVWMNFNRKKVNPENCLRLSVNTKKLNGSVPVMVYLHGDFLYDGNSLEAAPGYMLEEDVVLVSVRYRLGPFGFLSTMSDEIPGNAAVHDVILALQWIQKHIAHFGGDPSRVTLFGQVGGAAMINVLTMSPAVPENLFHRVILQSGSALSPAFITDDPMPAVKDIAKNAGCTNLDSVKELNKCLLQLNTSKILEAFSEHADSKAMQGIGNYGGSQFVIGGPSGVLPEHPGKLMAAESFKAYPTMGGSVKNAGSFILRDIFIDNFNESVADDIFNGNGYIEYFVNHTNGADPTEEWKKYATEEIFSADDIKNGSFHRMLPGLMDMCSTIAFKNPVLLALQANAKKLPKATYLYSFDYAGERNRYESLENDVLNMPFDLGVSLTDDNLYLFPWPQINLISSNRDLKIAKRMVALWTSFATTGVPQAPGLPEWPPMSGDTGPYMKLGTTVSIADNYLDEYTVAVKEAKMGYSLVNEDYFEGLEDVSEVKDVQPVKDDTQVEVEVESLRSNSN